MRSRKISELYKQGRKNLQEGHHSAAERQAENMLRIDPREAYAYLLKAQAMTARGLAAEAIEPLKTAYKLKPKDPRVLVSLAYGYQQLSEHVSAIAHFNKALKIEPGNDLAIAGKAKSYELQGNHKRAMKVLQRAMGDETIPAETACIYLRLLIGDKEYAQAIDVGERATAGDLPAAKSTRDLYFALASAYEKAGQYDKALSCGQRANEINRVEFNHEKQRKMVDRIISAFSAERMKQLPRAAGHDTSQPVFIVGMPRCGSTLTERMLDAHPEVHGIGESATLHLMATQMGMRIGSDKVFPESVEHLQPHVAEAESKAYLEVVNAEANGAKRIVDKYLANYLYIGLIHSYFPQARMIHTQRHPMDNCISQYFERLAPVHVPWSTSFDDLACAYSHYLRVIDHFQQIADVRMLDMQYEAIVEDQALAAGQVLEFCELPWDDRCLRFHETAKLDMTLSYDQVRRPIYKSARARAARFGALLDPLREALERHGVPVPDFQDEPQDDRVDETEGSPAVSATEQNDPSGRSAS